MSWAELLEAWLALTSVKYHDNLLVLMLFNQWLALTMLRATGPWINSNQLTPLDKDFISRELSVIDRFVFHEV